MKSSANKGGALFRVNRCLPGPLSEATNGSCSGSSGLAQFRNGGGVAGGPRHKKGGIQQRKFKDPVPEVDVTAKGPWGGLY